jgi:hypothetical protein
VAYGERRVQQPWTPGTVGQPDVASSTAAFSFVCQFCQKKCRGRSELR